MTYRSALLAACVTVLLLACGGESVRTGGAAGSSTAIGGHTSGGSTASGGQANGGSGAASGGQANGGSGTAGGGQANGGSSNAGGAGGATVCCDAIPVCAGDERQARASECPGQPSCHQLSLCCSSIWCVASGGSGAGGSAAGSHDCDGATCSATQACIAYRTIGGVFIPPDAGTCPAGRHLLGGQCQPDFAYKCADLHGACQDGTVTCACAQHPASGPSVCPDGFGSCSEPSSADTEAQLFCERLVP